MNQKSKTEARPSSYAEYYDGGLIMAAYQVARELLDNRSFEHTGRVVERVNHHSAFVRAAAWLHDVIEDADDEAERLQRTQHVCKALGDFAGRAAVMDAVEWLTRDLTTGAAPERTTYRNYIERIAASESKAAILVKRADLVDHLQLPDGHNPPLTDSHRQRYVDALEVLDPHSLTVLESAHRSIMQPIESDGNLLDHVRERIQRPSGGWNMIFERAFESLTNAILRRLAAAESIIQGRPDTDLAVEWLMQPRRPQREVLDLIESVFDHYGHDGGMSR